MIGQAASHYRIMEKLGEGGMGEVYLAEDSKLDRKVALKFLLEEMQADETAKKRFLQEAKAAAALDHPFICKIYEIGEEEGKSFISMEYIPGKTLKDKLAEGSLPLKDALKMATEIAEALEGAHKHNVVHRDLKPSNIMLTSEGHVKVMDFGLAKKLPPEDGRRQEKTLTALTREGSVLGTVPYMSPEQLKGESVDTRSDIFSFGVVFYEMLAGVHPFQKPEMMETASAILKDEPPLLPRYREDVPELLQHMVKKMLAKNCEERYQTPRGMLADLKDLATESPKETPQEKPTRTSWVLGLFAFVILMIAVVATYTQFVPSRSTPDSTAAAIWDLKVDEYESRARTLMKNFADPQDLQLSIENWEEIIQIRPDYAPALAGLATARTLIAWNSRPDPDILQQAEEEAQRALEINPELADAYSALAFVYALRGLLKTATEMSNRSIELAPHDPWTLQKRARLLMDVQGKFRSAEKLAQQATQIDPEFFPAWFQLGWARYELERYAEAEDSFRKAIALRPNFGAGFLGLGMILNATGRYLQSVSAFKKVLEINPDSVQGHFFLSFSYHYRGEHLKAVETLRAMLTMNPTHPLSAYAQLHVALQYKILERTSEQQTALEAAERMFKAQVGDPRAMVGLAGVQAIRGNTEQALDWLEQAVVKGFRYLNQINGSPSLDDLREHPRFSEIVKRIRLSLSSEP